MNKRKNLIWQLPFLTLLIVGTVLIVMQQRNMPYTRIEGKIFGTFYHITYQSDKDLKAEIEKALQEVDNSLSPFNPTSIITHVNNNEDVVVNKMFTDVYRIARKVSEETNGAFDITVAPLVNAWGFGFKEGQMPDKAAVDSLLQLIGYQKVSLGKNNRIQKADPRIMLDCSAVAKGYGCDVAASVLRRHDVTNYIVEIGGEVVTKGVNEKRVPWHIGINRPTDDPLQSSQEIMTILNVTDKAMATSGNYRNFYYKDGKKYAHTIDPTTGYPVQHSLLSATVLASDCATADAYATSFMVLGLEGAQAVLSKHPELMAYLIYASPDGSYQEWFTPSLKAKIIED
ncbi:MAG: FAD:protein FMN transferase [Prevotella sp.]|nr:FAD:protein FMN transferase [Prevotella sp.]